MLQPNASAYRGPERRYHRVFVTVNSEYHCHDRVCVAVVNRHTGKRDREHPAIGRRLAGSFRFCSTGIATTAAPEVPHEGEQLCFNAGRNDPDEVVTSTVERIERPAREVVASYARGSSPSLP